MNNYLEVGRVVEIEGKRIIIEANDKCNDLTYFYNGVVYRGVTVGQLIGIIRGPYILVGRIEKEYLEDKFINSNDISYEKDRYQRKLDIKMVGYIENSNFYLGIISYPMIYNVAIMLSDEQIRKIINSEHNVDEKIQIKVGTTVKEKANIYLNPYKLFNTHIGIFGNTGSGKSNTLAKLYRELFKKEENYTLDLSTSEFVFVDFNGEYVNENVLSKSKKVINLQVDNNSENKLKISNNIFWDVETLSILFSATEKTQKPFIKNTINYFLDKKSNDITEDSIINGICSAFYNTFYCNNNKEANNLLHLIYDEIKIDTSKIPFYDCSWNETTKTYYINTSEYLNNKTKEELIEKREELKNIITSRLCDYNLKITEKLRIAFLVELIYQISYGKAQYEHISPLIERMKSQSNIIDDLIEISDDDEEKNCITVVSLRNCSIEAKKIIPLLLAKNTYEKHKLSNKTSIQNTFHLIIDEAHNILSDQSTREDSNWKDYRLQVFEEMIKEGRKFGYYLTIASQRPADISDTIVSQIHNYFIHRLVSEQDLYMINNVVNTLDSVSRSNIPLLAPGQCIITGTSFDLPMVAQIMKLPKLESPNSESADLETLWMSLLY